MRKTLTTAALLLALSCSAFAGEIQTTGAPAPPPPQPASATEETALNGDMSTPSVTESLTQTVLELLAVLPSIF